MRRLMRDNLRSTAGAPTAPVQRTMSLAPLIQARNGHPDRPPWTALFVKGLALVAEEIDQLRQTYLAFPWGRLYQYDHSVAIIAVERFHAGEHAVFPLMIGHAAALAIAEIAARIHHAQSDDIDRIPSFRRALRMAALPSPIRRLAIWIGLNAGRHRAKYFGTFVLSTVTSFGAELPTLIWPVGTGLTYGLISDDGAVNVRIIFDHRITDAAVIARALARLEATLNGPIADELRKTSAPDILAFPRRDSAQPI
jgi:hypothetical protein